MSKIVVAAFVALFLAGCQTHADHRHRRPSRTSTAARRRHAGRRRPAARAPAASPASRRGTRRAAPACQPRCATRTTSCRKRSVYFDFDSFVVADEYKPLVEAHAQVPRSQPQRASDAPGPHRRARLARIQHRARPEARRRGQADDDAARRAGDACRDGELRQGEAEEPGPRRSARGPRTAASTSSTPASERACSMRCRASDRRRGARAALALARTQAHAGAVRRRRGAQAHRGHQRAARRSCRRSSRTRLADARAAVASSRAARPLARQLEGIKSDIARLRGQIEVLTYELERGAEAPARPVRRPRFAHAQDRGRAGRGARRRSPTPRRHDRRRPTDGAPARRRPSRRAAARAAGRRRRSPPRPSIRAAEQRAYDAALDQFKRGDYHRRDRGFSELRARRIRAARSRSSAQYWVGNAHFARKDYRAAIAAQRTLIQS